MHSLILRSMGNSKQVSKDLWRTVQLYKFGKISELLQIQVTLCTKLKLFRCATTLPWSERRPEVSPSGVPFLYHNDIKSDLILKHEVRKCFTAISADYNVEYVNCTNLLDIIKLKQINNPSNKNIIVMCFEKCTFLFFNFFWVAKIKS